MRRRRGKSNPHAALRWALCGAAWLLCPQGAAAQAWSQNDTQTLQNWASALAIRISDLIGNNGGHTATQDFVNGLQWDRTVRNATEVVEILRQRVGVMFDDVESVLLDLRRKSERFAVHGQFDTVFWDAEGVYGALPGDLISVEFNPNRSYSRRFGWNVDFDHSSVRYPQYGRRDDEETIHFVRWSSRLAETLRSNRYKSPLILNQYVASQTGALRVYPGLEWHRSVLGTPLPYRAQERSWFGGAATFEPRDVVIVIDSSASMRGRGRWATAVELVDELLLDFGHEDHVAIVLAGQPAKDGWEVVAPKETAEVLGCTKDRLVAATASTQRNLLQVLRSRRPYGGTRLDAGVSAALNLLSSTPQQAACQQALIVITDNQPTDPGAHCGNGSYDEEGKWQRPPLCDYSSRVPHSDMVHDIFGNLTRTMLSPAGLAFRGHVFAYDLSGGGPTLATSATCVRGRKGQHARLRPRATHQEVRAAVAGFRSWATRYPKRYEHRNVSWTEPYADAVTRLLVVSASAPFRVGGQLSGLVGVDVSFSDIGERIQSELWGDAYAFVLNRNGEAIVHPRLRDLEDVATNSAFPAIEDLEMYPDHNGVMQPTGFITVKEQMLAGKHGSVVLNGPIFWPRGSDDDGYDVIQGQQLNYTWGLLSQSASLTICIVSRLTVDDTTYTPSTNVSSGFTPDKVVLQTDVRVGDALLNRPVGLHNRLDKYNALSLQPHNLAVSDFTQTNYSSYIGGPQYVRWEIADRQTFQLPTSCFCNPAEYQQQAELSQTDLAFIDRQVNVQPLRTGCGAVASGGIYALSATCIGDLRMWQHTTMTYQILHHTSTQPINAKQPLGGTVRRFVGSRTGVYVQHPGAMLPKRLDPRKEAWYRQAVGAPRAIAVTPIFAEASRPRGYPLLIGISRAVMQGHNQLNNQTCAADQDCNSQQGTTVEERAVCWRGVCTSRTVAGVMGIHLGLPSWTAMITDSFPTATTNHKCGDTYSCEIPGDNSTDCQTRCYLLDVEGLVLWNSSSEWPGSNRTNSIPLGHREGELMRQLVYNASIYQRFDIDDHQVRCSTTKSWQADFYDQTRRAADWNGSLYIAEYERGPRPAAGGQGTERLCTATRARYRLSTAAFASPAPAVHTGTLNGCQHGDWAAALVSDSASATSTNMVIVMIHNYYDHLEDRWRYHTHSVPPDREFGCVVTNQAMDRFFKEIPLPACRDFTSAVTAAGGAAYSKQGNCTQGPDEADTHFVCGEVEGASRGLPALALAAALAVWAAG
eukprot:TRINITY_DN25935_c0_g1_i1.p1 TRINITY_DN25935_c0_g1~~TRINITY_DN25935_c0_g1_i1.p1  ORF type:complete len:1289 (+),score=285.33 TRINITY_DN25935_c0_g1_i1:82-3867(+)